jgi:hypothetical protein
LERLIKYRIFLNDSNDCSTKNTDVIQADLCGNNLFSTNAIPLEIKEKTDTIAVKSNENAVINGYKIVKTIFQSVFFIDLRFL